MQYPFRLGRRERPMSRARNSGIATPVTTCRGSADGDGSALRVPTRRSKRSDLVPLRGEER